CPSRPHATGAGTIISRSASTTSGNRRNARWALCRSLLELDTCVLLSCVDGHKEVARAAAKVALGWYATSPMSAVGRLTSPTDGRLARNAPSGRRLRALPSPDPPLPPRSYACA